MVPKQKALKGEAISALAVDRARVARIKPDAAVLRDAPRSREFGDLSTYVRARSPALAKFLTTRQVTFIYGLLYWREDADHHYAALEAILRMTPSHTGYERAASAYLLSAGLLRTTEAPLGVTVEERRAILHERGWRVEPPATLSRDAEEWVSPHDGFAYSFHAAWKQVAAFLAESEARRAAEEDG